jgi:hypothetical protein
MTKPAFLLATLATLAALAAAANADTLPSPLVPDGPARMGAQALTLDPARYEALRAFNLITLADFPMPDGSRATLDLRRIHVFTDDARVVFASHAGEVEQPLPDAQFFAGSIAGADQSRVFLALSPLATNGVFSLDGRTLILSSGPAGNGPILVYDTHAPIAAGITLANPLCDGALHAPGDAPAEPVGPYADRTGVCRIHRMAIDTDTEFTTVRFGGNDAASTVYAATIMAAMTEIYQRDVNIAIQVPFLRVWTTPSPYDAPNTGEQLTQFRTYWQNNMQSVSRTSAHLFSGRALGGGVAWLSQVCTSYAYAVSANINGFFPYPLLNNHPQNWDIMVTAHEAGHNYGTGHTHDPNHFDPPIDGCGNAYLNPPLPQDCSTAQAGQGTIMSYCHICPGGMSNLRMELGPRPAAAVRAYLDSRPSCGIVPTITITQQPSFAGACPGNAFTLAVAASGNTTRTFQWRRNGSPIPGATASTLAFSPITINDLATYDCVIASGCLSVTTEPASLSFAGCPCNPDFNADGNVDQDDLACLAQLIGGDPSCSSLDPDFNADGNVDQDDLDALAQVVAGGPCP